MASGRWSTDASGRACFDVDVDRCPGDAFHLVGAPGLAVLVYVSGELSIFSTVGGMVRIAEGTTVTGLGKGAVTTDRGIVRAPIILRCTEGFTTTIPGEKRTWLPLNSAQIATAPLPPEVWAKIGWQGHEIFGDFKNAYCYCQRTREGRITVGARGVQIQITEELP